MAADPEGCERNPQAFIEEAVREAEGRGRLKVFLGYAPGVGKTFKMLDQARRMKESGVDVAVGLVETHGRAETESLLVGLPVVPRRTVRHGSATLEEMDLDAILARSPAIVLIDELAHTNAPGSLHEKRHQDVEAILAEGISVYTTVNVQHLESLNDTVAQITGIRVRETIPDGVLDRADSVDMVDLPIEELQARLRDGKVYAPDLAGSALENFFKRGNLLALREVALRRVASKLDKELVTYMRARGIAGPWTTSERLLVCVGPGPYASRLVRKAFRMASDLKAEWCAVYVETPRHLALRDAEHASLAEALNLARALGARVVTLSGTEVVEEILRFAEAEKVSKVVIGKPAGSVLRRMVRGSPVDGILRQSGDFDVYLIAPGREAADGGPRARGVREAPSAKQFALAGLTLVPIWALAMLLMHVFRIQSVVTLFVLPPLVSAFFFGIGPSFLASVAAALVYDFFFTEPYHSLRIASSAVILEVVVFFATSILAAQVAKLVRRQREALRARLGQMELLADMGKELLAIPNIEQLLARTVAPVDENTRCLLELMATTVREAITGTVLRYMERALHLPCAVALNEGRPDVKVWGRSVADFALDGNDPAIVQWVFAHNRPAGRGTGTLEGSRHFFLPISTNKGCYGVVAVRANLQDLLPSEHAVASAIVNSAAIALESLSTQSEA